jgi:hypothetical protein
MTSIRCGGIASRLELLRWLAGHLDRVGRDASPLDGPLEHALEHRHRLADRLHADAGLLQVGPEVGDDLRREIAQRDPAEPWERVAVPERRVGAQGGALEVRARVDGPPFLDELGERLLAGIEVGERA